MANFDVKVASRYTLRESALLELRNAITTGALESGRHLGEIELSNSLGVSRGTLREALRHLQQEGLVMQDGRGRVSVKQMTPDDIRNLFEVRTGLEAMALTRLCAKSDRSTAVTELRALLDELRLHESDLLEGMNADLRFHEALCRLSGNTVLENSWRSLSGLVRLAMISAGPSRARANMAYERHAPIVQFIEEGDTGGGVEFLTKHMQNAVDVLLDDGESGQSSALLKGSPGRAADED